MQHARSYESASEPPLTVAGLAERRFTTAAPFAVGLEKQMENTKHRRLGSLSFTMEGGLGAGAFGTVSTHFLWSGCLLVGVPK